MEPDPALTPDLLRKPAAAPPPQDGPEVGEFRQGTPLGQWALSRYLVGRALTESVGMWLLVVALVLVGLAVASTWGLHEPVLAVLLVIVALVVLLLRWVLLTVIRRLTAFGQYEPVAARLNALVRDTRRDVFAELRRIGLPSHQWTLPLLAARLIARRRRDETVARLRGFDIARVVPKARLDETVLLVQRAAADSR